LSVFRRDILLNDGFEIFDFFFKSKHNYLFSENPPVVALAINQIKI